MIFFITLSLFLITTLAFFYVLYWFSTLDCDLELKFAELYGQKIENLCNKVIWITGASSGIGEHLAYVLASTGAKLALSGTSQERLEKVAKKCRELSKPQDNVLVLPFDMTNYGVHQAMLERVLEHFGRLDITVNNAGRSQRALFEQIDVTVDRALFEVNVFSLVNLSRVVLRYYLSSNPSGQLAVTSSSAGVLGLPVSASYTASKHALHGYFECLRNELGSKNQISITIFCPGPTFSNFLASAYGGTMGKGVEGDREHQSTARRMSTARCAQLMAVALANRMDEVWISLHPFLLLHYVATYLPSLSKKLLPRIITLERWAQIREGN